MGQKILYNKQDFNKVIWTDEWRATLYGSDDWAKGWLVLDHQAQHRYRQQQGEE